MSSFFQFHGSLFFDDQGRVPVFVPIMEYIEDSSSFIPIVIKEPGDATSIQWWSGKTKITKYIDVRFTPTIKGMEPCL